MTVISDWGLNALHEEGEEEGFCTMFGGTREDGISKLSDDRDEAVYSVLEIWWKRKLLTSTNVYNLSQLVQSRLAFF